MQQGNNNQGPQGNNNASPPGVQAVGMVEAQPQPQGESILDSTITENVMDISTRTEVKPEVEIPNNVPSGDARMGGYPKPESCGVNPKVVQMLDQRNRVGVNGGITNGGSDQMEVTVDQRFAQMNNNLNEYQKEQEEQVKRVADETARKMETVIERTLQQHTKITLELKGEVEGMRVHVNKLMDDRE